MPAYRIWIFVKFLGAGLIGLYLFLIVYFVLSQSRMIYYPVKSIRMTPQDMGMDYQAVDFRTSDGIDLYGWYIPAKDKTETVLLFCHGNAGNIGDRLDSIRIFHELGLDVFIFDYRGYGKSGGNPTEEGTYADARAAWDHLTKDRGNKPEDIIIFGRSLGGAVASRIAGSRAPRMLIIESAFTSIKDLGAVFYPYLPIKYMSRFDYNTLKYIKEVTCPLLMVHSTEDEVVPFKFGLEIYRAANDPKELLEISGTHGGGFISSGRLYIDGLEDFISRRIR